MSDKIIYNCHSHIFTHENIPNGYFPLLLVPAARIAPIRWALRGVMKLIVPRTKNDKAHRYAAFIKAAYRKRQEDNLKHLIDYYPKGTKFVILPMDMAYMGAGKIKEDIDEQHNELARLAKSDDYKDVLIPFAHIDPRRPSALERLSSLVEYNGFRGVKIYPTLGYRPDDNVLMDEIYPYMTQKNIPLLAHCSPGSVNSKDMSKKEAHALADPDNYKKVMEKYPELRICLGHFGGIGEWQRHLDEPRSIENPTWLKKITDLMQSGDYPNLYADISYTIFNFQENAPFLNILLQDERILPQVLFGSDFYMVESEKYSEKRLSTDLRDKLGEALFWKIANDNPIKYLGGE
jgi:predicted TIM-barrel fold metal-dependent hydrolase